MAALVEETLTAAFSIKGNHFWTFDWNEALQPEVAVCGIFLSLFGILCAAAGIGGGGIIVTVLMFFGQLTPYDAVPLSKAIVFFGSLASFALNKGKTFVRGSGGEEMPVVDWRICKLIIPMSLTGTLLGVLLNRHTPGWGVVVMLTAVLLFMTATVVSKGMAQMASEEEGAVMHSAPGGPPMPNAQDPQTMALLPQHEKLKKSGRSQEWHREDALLMGLVLIIVIFGGVLRHHTGFCLTEKAEGILKSREESACHHPVLATIFGSAMDRWLEDQGLATFIQTSVIVVPIWTCIIIAMTYSHKIVGQDGWPLSTVMMYQTMALITGLLAGLLGIGGGLIFSPFLVVAGIDPPVAVATSATCVIFTSSSTTIQYMLIDRIHMALAVVYGVLNVAASYVGTSLIHALQDKFAARQSYITFIVASAVAASAVLSVLKLIEEISVTSSTPTSLLRVQ